MLIGNIYFNRINGPNHTNWWEWDFYSKVCEIISKDDLVKKNKFRIYLTDPCCQINVQENDIVIATSMESYEIPNFINIPFLTFKQYVQNDIEDKLYGIPLGLNYPEIHTPIIPLDERKIDLCFLGQYENRYNRKHIIDFIKKEFQGYNILIDSNKSVVEYYLSLSNSKIVLALDGGLVPESYRFFESLRYGCIPIANEFLKSIDIYKNAPFIKVNWNNLNEVSKIIKEQLLKISNKKLDNQHLINNYFWKEKYSPEAQSNFILEKIHKKKREL